MPERVVRRIDAAETDGDELAAAFTFRKDGEQEEWIATCRHPECGAEWDVVSLSTEQIVVSRAARNSLLAHSRSHGMRPQLRRRK